MILKPQDLLILLKLVAKCGEPWAYAGLAVELHMSPAEVHSGIKRAIRSRLALVGEAGAPARPTLKALEEFVLHGVQYVFVPDMGGITRGIATAWAAPMVAGAFGESEAPPVWPHPEGKSRGPEFSPLYKAAPYAAMQDERLYELLALVDMLRGGRAREKAFAREKFRFWLEEYRGKAGG